MHRAAFYPKGDLNLKLVSFAFIDCFGFIMLNIKEKEMMLPLTLLYNLILDGSYVSVPSPLGKIKSMTKGTYQWEGCCFVGGRDYCLTMTTTC